MPYAPPSIPAKKPQTSSHIRLSLCNSGGRRPISAYAENAMMMTASVPFTSRLLPSVSSRRPSGIPNNVATTSHPALRTWMFRQSCAMITAATVMETSTASGAATLMGSRMASSGTATSASPNPNAERISVAAKITSKT